MSTTEQPSRATESGIPIRFVVRPMPAWAWLYVWGERCLHPQIALWAGRVICRAAECYYRIDTELRYTIPVLVSGILRRRKGRAMYVIFSRNAA